MHINNFLCRKSIRVLIIVSIILGIICVTSACTSSNVNKVHVATSVTPNIATMPTLQPISTDAIPVEKSWAEVVHLGQKNGMEVTQGEFLSNHPYRIFAICEGKGSMKVDFEPQGSTIFQCTSTPELQEINMSTPPKQEQVTIAVTPPDKTVWEVSIQLAQ